MKIYGIEGLSVQDVQEEVNAGGRFVIYAYCFSLVIITLKRSSDIYFIRHTENAFARSLKYTLISFLFGWWGIPWGIIYTISSLNRNIRGGKDVTEDVLQSIYAQKAKAVFEFEGAAD